MFSTPSQSEGTAFIDVGEQSPGSSHAEMQFDSSTSGFECSLHIQTVDS
jgi:hypothetical protein